MSTKTRKTARKTRKASAAPDIHADTDIVAWLRSILHNDRSVELRCREAANEIERLRAELEDARIQLANMEEDYFRMRDHDE